MNSVIMRDIPLALPAPRGLLEALLVAFFLLHIIFVHLMLGASLFSLVCQVKGLRLPDYDRLANRIVQTITVNKSLAVVLGVGPLLAINTIYTPYFYTSSALIGDAWMSVIPLVAIAFLLAYAHKYWWDRLAMARELHIGIAVIEATIFLIVPLIFMTNVNLMLFPDRWHEVKGFFSAMLLPNVLQRYLHFVSASVLFTTLFFAWWAARPGFAAKAGFVELRTVEVQRFFYSFAFGATILQILSGLLVFVTLPADGLSWRFVITLAVGAAPVLLALRWMWLDLTGPDNEVGRRLKSVAAVFAVALVAMGIARHDYRETALADHRAAVAQKTASYVLAVRQAAEEEKVAKVQPASSADVGGTAFEDNCAGCHGLTETIVGPSLKEIQGAYANNPAGIASWAKAPGKKRADAPQMPAFAHMTDAELEAIGRYILGR